MLVVQASHSRQFTQHTWWLVGGTSVACPTIYATYKVLSWWYECRMLNNLRYIHGVWLVVRPTMYFTNTEATVSWTSSWGVEHGQQRRQSRRRERDILRRQMETAGERKRSKVGHFRGGGQGLILSHCCSQSSHSVFLPLAHAQLMHQYSKCCSSQLHVFPVILSLWSLL